ncbi:ESPR-type extended signal peptide-containing protein [Xanthomonas hortorum pv. pelargonii]|nr:ESPR-type extended signal peptide-containing protein [Xanthomonas hortorum pv. pelargonii]
MNRAFALVWNAAIGNWVVTHELVRRRRKSGATRRCLSSLVVLAVGAAAPAWPGEHVHRRYLRRAQPSPAPDCRSPATVLPAAQTT